MLILFYQLKIIDPCYEHIEVDDPTRSISNVNSRRILSDMKVLNNTWYRFNAENSTMMITYPVAMLHCGTVGPGWLNFNHPKGKTTIL